jgi:ferric-chelate reductase [NAD(P)H]
MLSRRKSRSNGMNLKALLKISYGLYVISSKKGERFNGQIANTVFQVTSQPPTIAVSICKQNLTCEFIQKNNVFTVSILSKDTPMTFIGHFGFKCGRDFNKFEDINYKVGVTGSPIVLENTLGYLECKVVSSLDVGSHIIFIGQVVDADIIKDDEPMTYAYYREIKGGKSPKTAPTYIKEELKRRLVKCKNTNALSVVMFMILKRVTLILVLNLGLPLRNYQIIGYALYAGPINPCLKRRVKNGCQRDKTSYLCSRCNRLVQKTI